jgi:hypothetical protein
MSELTTQNLEYFCHAVEVLMSVQGAPFEESNWLAIMRIGGGNNVHIVFSPVSSVSNTFTTLCS